jgi:heme/copper-type cytochrome/quinol oxidase subunit 2
MNTLFHGDLLNFGSIVLIIMIVGGVVVGLTMFAESVWEFRRRRADRQEEQTGPLGPKPNEHEGKHLRKSA